MSGETAAAAATMSAAADQESEPSTTPNKPHITWSDSYTKAHVAIQSLASIIPFIPPSLSSSETPAFCLLHNSETAAQISKLLRQPDSGSGDNNLCRWLYDTFQSSEPELHLIVLRFLPIIAGVYLSRVNLHKPLAGFEAVLLALYSHETSSRNGQAITVNIPDLSHSSIYHETNKVAKNSATELNLAVISPSLEPYGTVRSMKRARIVGVALELYYSKIPQIPVESKLDFCEFCKIWSGQYGENDENGDVKKRINLPWELFQPVLRILGHCLMGHKQNEKLKEAAIGACNCLYERALHDLNTKAMLATGSLIKLAKLDLESEDVDYTEIVESNTITL
ncbi:PREDICTED: uncharacterized protein LOC109211863 [Nicotiana attenuata]|uniref:Hyccin n=1 Tax=Nicotiana attenuata TaxID=49451 RepID=A0A314KI96_NICAT|nr:PREDICTED: uncharacterized protein LOC109211863 [Nicotiana attenuata]OIT29053.1 hypothetical protein A4A49_16443 [Nicotiana attenuata]